MDHARPAQLIVVPAGTAGRLRGAHPSAALAVVPVLAAGKSQDHQRGAVLAVVLSRPDVRPSRHQANPSATPAAGAHYHYYRSGPPYGH